MIFVPSQSTCERRHTTTVEKKVSMECDKTDEGSDEEHGIPTLAQGPSQSFGPGAHVSIASE